MIETHKRIDRAGGEEFNRMWKQENAEIDRLLERLLVPRPWCTWPAYVIRRIQFRGRRRW